MTPILPTPSGPGLEAPMGVPQLPGRPEVTTLANGMTVCVLSIPRAPVVTSALFYRAGTRDEAPGQGGTAHFLEHMMFKGSARYGPGEIDLRTQALGGANNAFTTHDLTAYYFDFAPDRWREALAIEADRMAGLTLDPGEVASERQVILEEISMYEGDPWDALELAVMPVLFPLHAYGRPVLGTREELAAVGRDELAAFHHRLYEPRHAVLVVAGDVGAEALEAAEAAFGSFEPQPGRLRSAFFPDPPTGLQRVGRRCGEVARLLLGLPGPAADDPRHPMLRLLLAILAGGRASRLHRALVDEAQLCSWVTADLAEGLDPAYASVAAELVPGAEARRVEAEVVRQLAALATAPPSPEELERARRIVVADWVFGHEKVHHQALVAGVALALFDLDHPRRQLERMLGAAAEELPAVAERFLNPEAAAVVGWSLPERG